MKRSSFCNSWEFSRNGGQFSPVVVPHDAMLGERRGPDAPGASASGYYFGGSYRYRKEFTLSAEQAAGVVMLEFEGVYRDAQSWSTACPWRRRRTGSSRSSWT